MKVTLTEVGGLGGAVAGLVIGGPVGALVGAAIGVGGAAGWNYAATKGMVSAPPLLGSGSSVPVPGHPTTLNPPAAALAVEVMPMTAAYTGITTDYRICQSGVCDQSTPFQSVLNFQAAYNAMGPQVALPQTGVFDAATLAALNVIANMAGYGVFNTTPSAQGYLGYTPGPQGK